MTEKLFEFIELDPEGVLLSSSFLSVFSFELSLSSDYS